MAWPTWLANFAWPAAGQGGWRWLWGTKRFIFPLEKTESFYVLWALFTATVRIRGVRIPEIRRDTDGMPPL